MSIHRIHKWRTRGKKLMPSHESEALEDKQKLQMKTFSELAECLARIPPKITLYGLLFKYNYVGCLLLLMFSTDLLFAIKRDAYIFKETGWFCRFPKHQKLDKWAMAGEKRQTCWLKLHTETEYESQITAIQQNRKINKSSFMTRHQFFPICPPFVNTVYGMSVCGVGCSVYVKCILVRDMRE